MADLGKVEINEDLGDLSHDFEFLLVLNHSS